MADPAPRTADERGDATVCPLCKGAGFLKKYRDGIDARGGQELVPCDCTQESRRRIAWEKARANSNLPVVCHDQTFGNFRQRLQPEAFRAATEFCAHPDAPGWLVLQGDVGTGKTHLAAAIVNRLLTSQNWRPLYYVTPDLLDRLRSLYDSDPQEREREWKAIREASVLVLDDLGTEKVSDWADETLFKLLDFRYVNKLPLVVTTNLPLDNPDVLPPRIASRLNDRARSRVVQLRQGDYRQSPQRRAERLADLGGDDE